MQAKLTKRTVEGLKPASKSFDVFDLLLPGFKLRVSPSGKKVYLVRFKSPNTGTWTQMCLGDAAVLTPEQARVKAKAKLSDVAKGIDPVVQKRITAAHLAGMPTLGEFIEHEYLPEVLATRKSGAQSAQRIRSSFKEFLDWPLDRVNTRAIETWRAKRLNDKRSAGTVNRDVATLRACLNLAVHREVLAVHPAAKVRLMREDKAGKIRFLSAAEERRLLDALDAREEELRKARDSHRAWCKERHLTDAEMVLWPDLRAVPFADAIKPMVLLSLHTGMRKGEVFSLAWEDVALDKLRPAVTVRGEKAKSGSSRHIPLNTIAADVLRKWKKQTGATSGLVFPGKTGDRRDNVKKCWDKLLAAAKITDFRWHDMRHSFASRLVQSGIDLYRVQRLLGHASFAMTQRYSHLSPADLEDAVEALTAPRDNVRTVRKRKA